jgi:RNA polymerase sigma-70 factor (ECF subfamily)
MQIVTEWAGRGSEETRPAERAMLVRARAGDSGAMEDLLSAHERPLFSLCCGILGDMHEAEDAVQETYLRALRSLIRFRGDCAVRTWLHRIAVNVCLEWNRTRRFHAHLDESTALTSSPEAAVLRNLRISEALRTLMPRYRAIWLLKELEGWSVAEIAAAMRCSGKKVENDLYRARRMLAEWRAREDGGT